MKDHFFRRGDVLILICILALFVISAIIIRLLTGSAPPASVHIYVDGRQVAAYNLLSDREFTVKGYDGGTVHGFISGGTVDVDEASCPDKICVDHRPVSRNGESIICLPNKVVITVTSGEPPDAKDMIDAVSGN